MSRDGIRFREKGFLGSVVIGLDEPREQAGLSYAFIARRAIVLYQQFCIDCLVLLGK